VYYDYEWTRPLHEHARIFIRRGGRPIIKCYAVILQARVGLDDWRTVCVIDNHMDKCHLHRYDGEQKLASEPFGPTLTVKEELARAINHLVDHHHTIIGAWERAHEH
jgi:hypothetical protein